MFAVYEIMSESIGELVAFESQRKLQGRSVPYDEG